jgi:succinate dehydrogenase / fumarate reductase, flavoprotein subunit
MNTHQFDVVVVGAGGAGLMAGLYASRTAKTAIISKLYPDPFTHRRSPGRH